MSQSSVWIDLVESPIDLSAWQAKIADPDVGAHGWFLGVTRRSTRAEDPESGKVTTRVTTELSYEAHHAMARAELDRLASQAVEKFGLAKLVIVHRLGVVPVGQASVLVGCSSPHRRATFAALAWIMESLKQEVPIWKRERYDDQSTQWIHPTGHAT